MALAMLANYWLRHRLSRRRLLSASAGAASLALLACSSSASRAPSQGLVNLPVNRTAEARAGGTLLTYLVSEVGSFDPLSSNVSTTHTQVAALSYPRLIKFSIVPYPERAIGAVEGDLVESFEFSQDRLQLTLKLREGPRWDARPPTNGRPIDSQDVVFSWNKFARGSPLRNEMIYNAELAPGRPFESISAPDPRTVLLRLKQPDSSALGLLASDRHFYVMPRESDGGFDPRVEVRGYGPWLLAENRPGVQRVWTRNPDYHVKGRPFPDRLEQAIASDYASRLAQFRAGLIWTNVAAPGDVLPTRRDLPELLLMKVDSFATAPSSLAFGYDGDSPWRDERMRHAVSRLIDRETLVSLKSNRDEFEANGLPVDVRYHTAIGAGWEGYWVDPKSALFGPAGRFYDYDPDEARKLMVAAGYVDGVDTLLHYNGGNEYLPGYTRTAELVAGMLAEGRVRARLDPHEYQTDWLPNYHLGYSTTANPGRPIKGFPGLIYRTVSAHPTPGTQAYSTFHRLGSRFHGMTPTGRDAHLGDPDVNRLIEAMRREFDARQERMLALELARHMAARAYDIPMLPHSASTYSLTWPVIANLGAFAGWPTGNPWTEANLHLWIDTTKPPLAARPS